MPPEKIYADRLAQLQQQITKARGQLQVLGWVRLGCFVGILVCAWQYIAKNFEPVWWLPILALLAGFIYALAKYQRVKDKLELLLTLQQLNE